MTRLESKFTKHRDERSQQSKVSCGGTEDVKKRVERRPAWRTGLERAVLKRSRCSTRSHCWSRKLFESWTRCSRRWYPGKSERGAEKGAARPNGSTAVPTAHLAIRGKYARKENSSGSAGARRAGGSCSPPRSATRTRQLLSPACLPFLRPEPENLQFLCILVLRECLTMRTWRTGTPREATREEGGGGLERKAEGGGRLAGPAPVLPCLSKRLESCPGSCWSGGRQHWQQQARRSPLSARPTAQDLKASRVCSQ